MPENSTTTTVGPTPAPTRPFKMQTRSLVSCLTLASRSAQTEELLGRLATRASRWSWAKHYARWLAGAPLSSFERRWLALSARCLSRFLAGEPLEWSTESAKTKALPRRAA